MKSFISFANPKIRGNPLLFFTYLVVSPLARVLALAHISPHNVTHLSNLAFGACLYFFLSDNAYAFSISLVLSFILDVADGMVARFTNTSTAYGSLYDHSSDDIKIFLLLFVVGFHFGSQFIWCLVFIASGVILLVSTNSYSHAFKDAINGIVIDRHSEHAEVQSEAIWPVKIVRGVARSIFRLDGNFMYYFFFLNPSNQMITEILLIIIIFVTTTNLLYSYIKLIKQVKYIDKKNLKWK